MMRNPNSSSRATLLFIIIVLLHVAADSASPNNSSSITIGSSLSINGTTSYWLSPSGYFAFGFYPSGNGQYQVGIWINKGLSCGGERTLVWSITDLDKDIGVGSDESSILLNNDGVFVLQRPGTISKPLFCGAPPTASYAFMQDTGNFVVYDSSSNIIWQSFDYPTDTIISGQTLKSAYNLRSNFYKLTICIKGTLIIEDTRENSLNFLRIPKCRSSPLNLDLTGHLYLVDNNGLVTKNLTTGDEHVNSGTVRNTIYRATLEADGVFRLYREKIGSECGETVELWHSRCSVCTAHYRFVRILGGGLGFIFWTAILIILSFIPWRCCGQRSLLQYAGLMGVPGVCLVTVAVIIYFGQIVPYY